MNVFSALLFVIAYTNYGYDPICALFPSLNPQEVFYVLRGIEGAVLFCVIGYLRPALWWVCAWGAIEESETAVCGLHGNDSAPWMGLCADATGLPLYMLGIVYMAILIRRLRDARSRS